VALLARPNTVQALTTAPLRLVENGHTTTAMLHAAVTPAELAPTFQRPALAILCVKGYDTPSALPALQQLQPARVLSLQNGLDNEELLATHFGADHVLAGSITSSVEPDSPTSMTVTKRGGIGLAALEHATTVPPWVALFQQAGFRTRAYPSYKAMKWSKVLLNMLGNATAAILDMSVEAVYADPRMIALERAAFLEATTVMARLGLRPINLPSYPAGLLATAMRILPTPLLYPLLRKRVAGGRGGKDPSLLRDLRAGRKRSEGEFLYGAIARHGQAAGVATPLNQGLWRILQNITTGQRPWGDFRHQPEKLLVEVQMGR
jgi:2-dehydropantoate 2-reductase